MASTDAAAPAVIAGWRVARLVTQAARPTRSVRVAARVSATQRSIALPGVSAMPRRSQPSRSASRAMRDVYSGDHGQKKKPKRAAVTSRLDGRVRAVVRRRLEELVRSVRPELRHHGIRVDHGVLQPSAGLLDAHDVDVLGGVVVLVELDRPARILGRLARPAQRDQEAVAVLDVAAERARGLEDPPAGAVHDGVEVRRRALDPGLGQLRERPVGGVVEGRRPDQRADVADDLVAHALKRGLVGEDAGADQRHLAGERALAVLLGEAHRLPGHEDLHDRVDVARHLREIRREIHRVQRRPDLLHDAAAGVLEHALEAADALVTEVLSMAIAATRRYLSVRAAYSPS